MEITDFSRETWDKREGKTALVLAGGGFTGGVFEIGAARALNDIFENFSITDFDIYTGVSAGSFVAACLANGISAEEMFKSLIETSAEIPVLKREYIFYPNMKEFKRRLKMAPYTIMYAILNYLRMKEDMRFTDMLFSLTELLPSGIFSTQKIEEYLRFVFSLKNYTNDFRKLKNELYIPAVDLNTGETIIFGEEKYRDIPISKAVSASISLPGLYSPTVINNIEFVDGGIDRNLYIDLAVKHGAKLIVCINPVIPIYNNPEQMAIRLITGRTAYLSQKGVVDILSQTLRIILQKRIDDIYGNLTERYPDIDIIIIQPEREDATLFSYNVMRYSTKIILARYGFLNTRKLIEKNFDELREKFSRHGIRISTRLLNQEYDQMKRAQFNLNSVVNILSSVPFLRRLKKTKETASA
ncbi:MAG: patatin-like phospholipase family protein [Deltaproteobacteria bacterium]|nr:patatin-like phospholipase family protein [Deltaproteobacteria bacterium]